MATEEPWATDEPGDLSPGLTEPVRAIRDALPTSRHAKMLFDMVVELLGARAVVETSGGKTRYALFCREGPGSASVVPWPLLRLGVAGRLSTVIPVIGSAEPPPRPGSPPRLRNLGPGEVVIHDGPHEITVTYGDDGRWMETSRSEDPETLAGVLPVLSRGTARPVELLAESLAILDIARHGPGRVLCPEPVPSVQAAWNCGLLAIRDALFDGRISSDARWAVADGYEGAALAWGTTREDAISAWRAEILRAPPSPPRPAASAGPRAEPIGPGFEIRGAPADGGWPEEAPAVTIPLDPVPKSPSSWGSFVRLLGGFGGTRHALVRRDPGGFTLVGDRVVDLVDLDELDHALSGIEPLDHPELAAAREAWLRGRPGYDSETIVCRVVDERRLFPVTPSCVESQRTRGFLGRMLDGDRLRLRVVRQRRLE